MLQIVKYQLTFGQYAGYSSPIAVPIISLMVYTNFLQGR